MKKTIAVLLTCHNRKEKTLQCLGNLYAQQGLEEDYTIEVFLVDDGSTDGTADAIQFQFPKVTIIPGDGNLYWNRGMYKAWETAANTKRFDYYLWLNDDTFLFKNAIISSLNLDYSNAVIVGTTHSSLNQKPTYGGTSSETKSIIRPNGLFQKCYLINGNFLLISKGVYNIIGKLDPIFHHALGDFDYYFRGRKLGVEFYVAPEYVGICEDHITEFKDSIPKWRSNSIPVMKRLKLLYQPQSGCVPKQFFIFKKRHVGLLSGIYHFCLLHVRCIFPNLWKVKSLFK